MNDKSIIKIICRIITLIEYIAVLFLLFIDYDFRIAEEYFSENRVIQIVICTVPLLVMMLFSLIIKYTCDGFSKRNIYRVTDVITRLVSTIPITIYGTYYITMVVKIYFSLITYMCVGVIVFVVLNFLFKLALQETMDVTYMRSDSL